MQLVVDARACLWTRTGSRLGLYVLESGLRVNLFRSWIHCTVVTIGNMTPNRGHEEATFTAGLHHGVEGKDWKPLSSSLPVLTLNKATALMVMGTGGCCTLKISEVITPLDVSVTQGMTRGKLILKSCPIKKLDSPCYWFAPVLKYVKCHNLLIPGNC